jgi:hypothetical protein
VDVEFRLFYSYLEFKKEACYSVPSLVTSLGLGVSVDPLISILLGLTSSVDIFGT